MTVYISPLDNDYGSVAYLPDVHFYLNKETKRLETRAQHLRIDAPIPTFLLVQHKL